MPDQSPQSGRRQHFHRGRRGPDRRGQDRRPPQSGHERPGGDHVDVEQIMRNIRAQISQRHGIELSNQQIQELAARRLEAILDPRTVKPTLLEQLRRSAGGQPETQPAEPDPAYTFEGDTLYESRNGLVRFFRKLLNPILRLFFNPNPLIHALNAQARLNKEAWRREAERERRQTEWNALHYSILQRLVTEVSRASVEAQSLGLRVESLAAKVDFNERRVRGLEKDQSTQASPVTRSAEPASPMPAPSQTSPTESPSAEGQPHEGQRRRRRRRRGRRGPGMAPTDASIGAGAVAAGISSLEPPESEDDLGDDDVSASDADASVDEPALESAAPVPWQGEIATAASEPAAETQALEPSPMESSSPTELSPRVEEETTQPSPAPDEPFPLSPGTPPDSGPTDR